MRQRNQRSAIAVPLRGASVSPSQARTLGRLRGRDSHSVGVPAEHRRGREHLGPPPSGRPVTAPFRLSHITARSVLHATLMCRRRGPRQPQVPLADGSSPLKWAESGSAVLFLRLALGAQLLACARTVGAVDAGEVRDGGPVSEVVNHDLGVVGDLTEGADARGEDVAGWVRCGALRCAPSQLCVFRRDRSPPGDRCVPRDAPPTPPDSQNLLAFCDGPEDCPLGETCKDITSNFPSLRCRPTTTPCFQGERRLCESVVDCPTCDRPLRPTQSCNPLGSYPVSICLF